MISDTPGRGGGGVKKGQIYAEVLYGWPLNYFVFVFDFVFVFPYLYFYLLVCICT